MAEGTINDTQMTLVTLHPDGTVDGAPQWSVVSGNSTMLGDPAVWDAANLFPDAHAAWDAALPEGYQMFLVSETLADTEDGPVDTEYLAQADVDKGTGVELLTESLTLHVVNRATTLGVTMSMAIGKP
jgi:hypothetical protein